MSTQLAEPLPEQAASVVRPHVQQHLESPESFPQLVRVHPQSGQLERLYERRRPQRFTGEPITGFDQL